MATSYQLVVEKSPSDELSLRNCAVINEADPLATQGVTYVEVLRPGHYYLTLAKDKRVKPGKIGLSGVQRDWLSARLGSSLQVKPTARDVKEKNLIGSISVEVDFLQKTQKAQPAINTDDMASFFREKFCDNVFCSGQVIILGSEKKIPLLKGTVLQIIAEDMTQLTGEGSKTSKKLNFGVLYTNSRVTFEKKPDSSIQLIGRHRGDSAHVSIISPDWDFKQMGIGGLDKEFSDIFRRAFASRVFPPDIIEKLGMKHVRGILLYGPPGTGKTLMARQIGKMLHAKEPKIVNGPEVLNKYVGESEANIRGLFAEAEADQKKLDKYSPLHIIIFDELDAICRQRGSLSGSTGVHDTVVNQLLAKIDGVEQLNNILLIGMTNRIDMIDEALLRPGRLEVKMEIGLPNENGRLEILHIHTAQMRKNKMLSNDIDLPSLAKKTRNFSGAEIEGLVRSAQSTAMNKMIKAKDKVTVSVEDAERLKVTMVDFEHAIQFDVKPAFGISDEQLENYVFKGIIPWGPQVQEILDLGKRAVQQTVDSMGTLVSVLLRGDIGCGKTALAAHIARESYFPFVKVVTPENMIGFSENAKCQAIKKIFDDAYKSELSCIVIDDIERLLDYVAIGPRFSNAVLQVLLVLLRKQPPVTQKVPHRLLIIGTTGFVDEVLELTGIQGAFDSCIEVPSITSGAEVMAAIKESNMYKFTSEQLAKLEERLKGKRLRIGIKKLLAMLEASLQTEDCVASLTRRLQKEANMK